MSRLPFDPEQAAGPPPEPRKRTEIGQSLERSDLGPAGAAGGAGGRKRFGSVADAQQLTVTQVSELIKNTLEQRIASPLRIIGQVSNFSHKAHWYFTLKDDQSVLSCVAWATAARKFNFTPKDGDEVVATGHISHYPPQGRTQLYVSDLSPVGAGALELRFRALCDELRRQGYFDDELKKPLPMFPRRIAVITSATGAAMQDVINTAAQRCKAVALLIVDVRVQGNGAAQEIADAIRWVDRNRERLAVDAMLITRGGGSIEDLWAFNERMVAEAVFGCALPVVAAIGHESDTTIVELVADVRASTPTQAVMRLVPSSQELCKHLDHLAHRIGFHARRLIERQQARLKSRISDLQRIVTAKLARQNMRLERLATRLARLHPRAMLIQRQARLAVMVDRLDRSIGKRLDDRQRVMRLQAQLGKAAIRHLARTRQRLGASTGKLAAMDPHGVLRRGYSITMKKDGAVIRSVSQAAAGEPIISKLADGSIHSIVASSASRVGPPGRKHSRTAAQSADQLDLFDPAQ